MGEEITEIDEKVRITIPNLVQGNMLTPFISIQKPEEYPYTPDLSIVEVAISPQDSINEDIISQLGSFNIDDYIGDPRLDSSSTYPALTDLRKFYFKKYSKSQNLFDIIKLLSYFDNSLFKMIKDFVPARTNLSTGLIIKSHILERNKIARNEPTLTFVNYSGSIETAFISGSNGLNLDINTDNTTVTQYISGSIIKSNIDKRELITGELGGTVITAHTQPQDNVVYEYNNIPVLSSTDINQNYSKLPLNPTLNNVSQARTSRLHLDVDYAYNPITPVNFDFLKNDLFSDLKSQDYPFLNSPVQDSNYTLKRHTDPRYNGSKTNSSLYNVYTEGDTSYGSTAAIDTHPKQFAYFKEITSQSATLNGRSNVNIKYLIDSASNITELTEANKNLFDIQGIFNKVKANIALEDINKPSKQKSLNGLKEIYAGGFRYEPILQNYVVNNVDTPTNKLSFNLDESFEIINPASGSQTTSSLQVNRYVEVIGASIQAPSVSSFNVPKNTLNSILNTPISIQVKRNEALNSTIYQKISGEVSVTVSISPAELLTTLYQNSVGFSGGIEWINVPLGSYPLPTSLNPQPNFHDLISSAIIPIGVTGKFYGDSNFGTGRGSQTITGSGVRVNTFGNGINNDEIDSFSLESNASSASFNTSNVSNPFGVYPSFSKTPGIYPIPTLDGLSVTVTFQISGYVICMLHLISLKSLTVLK